MKILKKIIEFIVIDIMVALLLMLLAMVLLFIPGLSETIHWYSIAAAGILHFPIAITIFLVNEKIANKKAYVGLFLFFNDFKQYYFLHNIIDEFHYY